MDILRRFVNWIRGFTNNNKRKHEECETMYSKRARMDDSFVEVVEFSDESLSEVEEMEITEPGPSTISLRTSSPAGILNLTESKLSQSYSSLYQPFKSYQSMAMVQSASVSSIEEKVTKTSSFGVFKKKCSKMEDGYSASNISNSPSSSDCKAKTLDNIIKNFVLPEPQNTELSDSGSGSPLSLHRKHSFNLANLSQTSGKKNFLESGFYENKIIRQELFYERVMRKLKENQAATHTLNLTYKKPIEEIFKDRLDDISHELQKIQFLKKEIFPGQSQEIFDYIKLQMSRPDKEKIFPGKNMTIKDLKTVYQHNGWLNDEVIDHYLAMIVARDSNSLHMFGTFFYTQLSNNGYASVRRWSRKKDIFACNKMLTPIHMGNHWCFVCVNFVEKTIKYYDSLKGKNYNCLNHIFNYLKEEFKDKKNKDFDPTGWQLMDADDCPIQHNTYDCGVFLCATAEFLARDAVLDYVQEDMPLIRLKICYEILKNKLLY